MFTLTKEGKSQEYTVYITKSLASDCSISSFKLEKTNNEGKIFADREGVISETDGVNTITLHVSDAAILTELNPTIAHTGGASIASGGLTTEPSNNTTTVNYTVTAADGETTKVYAVKYVKSLSSDNRISEFKFNKDDSNSVNTGLKLTRSSAGARPGDVVISNNNTNTETISVKVSTEADITNLIPTITKHERATISPTEDAHNYATPKTYTITAQDGQTKEYTVSVAKSLSNTKEITSFKFESSVNSSKGFGGTDYSAGTIITPTGDGDVNVSVKIPASVTSLDDLKPTIVTSDSNAKVNPANQIEQNFNRGDEKTYVVTAEDGTTRNYKITIPTLDVKADITSFRILKTDHTSITPSITDMTITPTNNGSDYTIVLDGEDNSTVSLSPEITLSAGATVNPASKAPTTFTYGTAQTYTVTAEDGTAKVYSVTVKSSNSKMKSFAFKNGANSGKNIVQDIVVNSISGNTITVKVPYNTDVTALTPEILLYNGASITSPSGGATTAQNFSSGVIYTITAQDGKSTTEYTVTVTQNAAPQIETFKFMTASNNSKNLGNDISGTIDHSSGTITVKVPHDATLTDLTPTVAGASNITVYKGGASSTEANTSNDFTNSLTADVQYSAVDAAGGRKVYNVKVYKEPAITSFKFTKTENSGASFPDKPTEYTTSSITQGNLLQNGTIAITVANTVDVTNLKATITGNNTNATNPVDITFTSTSGTSNYSATIEVTHNDLPDFRKQYTITVSKEAAPQLTGFTIAASGSKGIQNDVSAEFTHPSNSDGKGGKMVLKFPKNNEHAFDLKGLSYTIAPVDGHTLTPNIPLEDSESIDGKKFTLTKDATGSTSEYTVEAVKGPYISKFDFKTANNSDKNLGSDDVVGTIDHAAGTITLEVPKEVSESPIQLTPTIEVGGDSVTTSSPDSETAQSFTPNGSTTVDYTVTGAESMTKVYKVTVTKASS
ncbi:DUF5018 domain-containing protein [Ichthyobacterium seriolicida]|uniref:Pkd domain containing protein n=1 Tax=Ichthyobacterium seriolicida TaxID=242600 RepID=A0A1J1E3L0_9FLAO|nr:hypothetical protein [Ichthyobacterium seriolicida]BAV94636.1 pkd domain containing protein [Ichthyobacterium seriolicida]